MPIRLRTQTGSVYYPKLTFSFSAPFMTRRNAPVVSIQPLSLALPTPLGEGVSNIPVDATVALNAIRIPNFVHFQLIPISKFVAAQTLNYASPMQWGGKMYPSLLTGTAPWDVTTTTTTTTTAFPIWIPLITATTTSSTSTTSTWTVVDVGGSNVTVLVTTTTSTGGPTTTPTPEITTTPKPAQLSAAEHRLRIKALTMAKENCPQISIGSRPDVNCRPIQFCDETHPRWPGCLCSQTTVQSGQIVDASSFQLNLECTGNPVFIPELEMRILSFDYYFKTWNFTGVNASERSRMNRTIRLERPHGLANRRGPNALAYAGYRATVSDPGPVRNEPGAHPDADDDPLQFFTVAVGRGTLRNSQQVQREFQPAVRRTSCSRGSPRGTAGDWAKNGSGTVSFSPQCTCCSSFNKGINIKLVDMIMRRRYDHVNIPDEDDDHFLLPLPRTTITSCDR